MPRDSSLVAVDEGEVRFFSRNFFKLNLIDFKQMHVKQIFTHILCISNFKISQMFIYMNCFK